MTREEAIRIIETVFQDEYVYKYYDSITHQALDMAIEALKREDHDGCDGCKYEANDEYMTPCNKCKQNYKDEYKPMPNHDRDWIVGCIKHDGFVKTDRRDKANQIILDALSADRPKGEWIPCSERLPEVGEICLLTVHEYGWNCKDYTRVIIGEYSDNYADHILAWMPLPTPYRERSEE